MQPPTSNVARGQGAVASEILWSNRPLAHAPPLDPRRVPPMTGLGEAALAYAAAGYAGVPAARQAAPRQLPGLRAALAPLPAPPGPRMRA